MQRSRTWHRHMILSDATFLYPATGPRCLILPLRPTLAMLPVAATAAARATARYYKAFGRCNSAAGLLSFLQRSTALHQMPPELQNAPAALVRAKSPRFPSDTLVGPVAQRICLYFGFLSSLRVASLLCGAQRFFLRGQGRPFASHLRFRFRHTRPNMPEPWAV